MSEPIGPKTRGERPSYYPALDGVRAVLLVSVLLRHYNHFWTPENLAERLYLVIPNLAIPALDVFFAMSGFLITGILVDTKARPFFFKNFYARRVLRILPPYYAFLTIWFLILPRFPWFHDLATPFSEQAWYWFHALNFRLVIVGEYLQDPQLYHLWSLAFEEQFYVLWPAVVFALSSPALLRLCAVAFVAALAWRLGVVVTGAEHVAGFVLLPARLDPLAAGAALALLVRQPGWLDWLVPRARVVLAASFAAMLGLIATRRSFLPNDPVILTLGLTVSAIFAASVVASVLRLDRRSLGGMVLLHPAVMRVGTFTYAAYIWHWPVETFAQHLGLDYRVFYEFFGNRIVGQLCYWAVLFLGAVGMGAVSWYAIEAQCLKLKRFFSYRTAPQGAGVLSGGVG